MLTIDVWGNDPRPRPPQDTAEVKLRFGSFWSYYWRNESRRPPYPRRSWIALQRKDNTCLILAEASPSEAEHLMETLQIEQRDAIMHKYPSDLGISVYSTSVDDRFPGLAGLWVILRAWTYKR